MPTGPLYRIQSITSGTVADTQGRIVRTKLIKFMVGDDGPFTWVAPFDRQTPDLIAQDLTSEANDVMRLRSIE